MIHRGFPIVIPGSIIAPETAGGILSDPASVDSLLLASTQVYFLGQDKRPRDPLERLVLEESYSPDFKRYRYPLTVEWSDDFLDL